MQNRWKAILVVQTYSTCQGQRLLRDIMFADDCAPNPGSEPEMQVVLDKFSTMCNNFASP